MKPNTTQDAFKLGERDGRDTSGMAGYYSTWPTNDDFDAPDALTKAYMKGFISGAGEKHETVPAWAMDEEPQRSDAAPGL